MTGDFSRRGFAALLALALLGSCGGNGEPDPDTEEPLTDPAGAVFSFERPGALVDGSGDGVEDGTVYAPGIRYPLEEAPSYANSQVYGAGGMNGPPGGQCAETNYGYPWRDNFCETRPSNRIAPLCPQGFGHQGQDIRPKTCRKSAHWAVAAEAGRIAGIGIYTVTLQGDSGTQYRYLHMDMGALSVVAGQRVTAGQRLGLVSNDFGGSATTIHLHFEIRQNVEINGDTVLTFVPPYASLVDAYRRLLRPG